MSLNYKSIADNCKSVFEKVQKASEKAGHKARIMAVTKTIDIERINEAVSCGIDLLGENRAQEFLEKRSGYPKSAEVHFIGGLQTNKVRQIIDKVDMIQSLDTHKLGEEISRLAVLNNRVMDVLIQVNIGGELTKNGVAPQELDDLTEKVLLLGAYAKNEQETLSDKEKDYLKNMATEIVKYYNR